MDLHCCRKASFSLTHSWNHYFCIWVFLVVELLHGQSLLFFFFFVKNVVAWDMFSFSFSEPQISTAGFGFVRKAETYRESQGLGERDYFTSGLLFLNFDHVYCSVRFALCLKPAKEKIRASFIIVQQIGQVSIFYLGMKDIVFLISCE